MHKVIYISLLVWCLGASAQQPNESDSNIYPQYASLSASELITEARNHRDSNPSKSMTIASEALRKAYIDEDLSSIARSQFLLGRLEEDRKNTAQAYLHYENATENFEKLGDVENQIRATLDIIELLVDDKEFEKTETLFEQILQVAIENKKPFLIAIIGLERGTALFARKHYTEAIDQLYAALEFLDGNSATVEKRRGQAYKKLAESYNRLKKPEKSAEYYDLTLQVYTSLGEKRLMARTLNTLAEAHRNLGNFVIALDYSMKGLEIHKEIDDPKGRAKALGGAGIIYRHIGRFDKSLENVYQAHLYYKEANDINGIAKSSNQMGLLYTRLKQFEEAKSFYQLTIDQPKNKIEATTLAAALREMAVIELSADNFGSALSFARRAQRIYQEENDKLRESITTRIIGNVYRERSDFENGVKYYRESLSLAEESGSILYQVKALRPIGEILTSSNIEEAYTLMKRAMNLASSINETSEMLYTSRELRHIEKLRGNVAQALGYAEKELELTARIQQEREDNEVVFAKANLHSHKLEVEIESLKEKAILDQLELAQKNHVIELSKQTRTITELELAKNKYAKITLTLLLIVCLFLVVVIYQRFKASKARNIELNDLAEKDPLTNCFNRRVLFEKLEKDFQDLNETDDYCVLMADIDNFKHINDSFGHSVGDTVIKGLAETLQQCARQGDLIARYGGEEFCMVLPNTSEEDAAELAETMRKHIEKASYGKVDVTCSFGISSVKFKAKDASELIDQADTALYRSKALGRNRVTLWELELER